MADPNKRPYARSAQDFSNEIPPPLKLTLGEAYQPTSLKEINQQIAGMPDPGNAWWAQNLTARDRAASGLQLPEGQGLPLTEMRPDTLEALRVALLENGQNASGVAEILDRAPAQPSSYTLPPMKVDIAEEKRKQILRKALERVKQQFPPLPDDSASDTADDVRPKLPPFSR